MPTIAVAQERDSSMNPFMETTATRTAALKARALEALRASIPSGEKLPQFALENRAGAAVIATAPDLGKVEQQKIIRHIVKAMVGERG
jgi:hypothetical protein